MKQGFDRAGDVAQLGRSPLVEGLETPFELRGRLFVPAAQLLADGAAPRDERLLDGRELRCEIVRQRVRALADLHDEFAAAPVDGALETREPVAERDFDPPGVRGEGGVDRIEVGRRDRLELPETLGGLGREVFEVRVEPRVEVVAARPHHRIDRIDVACEFCVQLVGVRNDPVGHAVSVFADQVVERFQIVAHASGLLGQRLDQPAAALADDGVEGRHLRAQRVVNAARAGRDGRGGLASQCDELLGDLRGARVQAGERRGGRLLDLGLRGRALDGNRSHDPLGRIVHQGLENGGVAVDGAAQLGLSRVETLGPPRGRGLERRRRILGALPQHRSEPLARSVQPIAERRATLDQRLVKAFGDAAEPLDQIVALPADGVGQARLASLDPVHQRQRPLREVARHRVVRFDKASRDRLALGPDRLDGFRAAGAEAADDGVGVALDGVPHDRRGLGEPVLHRISLDLDGFSRFGEAGDDCVGVALDGAAQDRRGLGEPALHHISLDLDGFSRFGEPGDDCVGVALDGAAHDQRRLGEPVLHHISLGLDGFSRFGEPGRNGVAMAPQRRDDVGAARVEPTDHRFDMAADGLLGAVGRIRELRGDGLAARAERVEGLLVARPDAPDDIIGVSGERARHGERRLDHLRGEFALPLPNGVDGARRARSHTIDDLVRSIVDGARQRFRRAGKPGGDRRAMAADRLDSVRAASQDAIDDFVAVRAKRVRHRRRRLGEPRRDPVAVPSDGVDGVSAA